ncbi:MAG TPA: hypothetical protein VMV94_12340 [Phycisphaerae bacterium]|nr:hypothetical protein [Phycisphaerae bacterium]
MSDVKIRRALIAVYDKTGIAEFARTLVEEFGIEIISTGGTAKHLKEAGIPVTLVEEVTGFPEMLDGRVKTLHPKIHAAILADRDNPEHMRQLKEHGIEPIDMVVVNLYPFEKTVADPNCTFEQAIEMIDIGGPCLLRAAAKNHKHVVVVHSTSLYGWVIARMRMYRDGADDSQILWDDVRSSGAFCAFWTTADYDAKVAKWLSAQDASDHQPTVDMLRLWSSDRLRYGENPHQRSELFYMYGDPTTGSLIPEYEDESPRPMSHNNYLDADAALRLCGELTRSRSAKKLAASGHVGEAQGGLVKDARTGSAGSAASTKLCFVQGGEQGARTEGGSTKLCFGASDKQEPDYSPTIRNEVLKRRKLPHWQMPGACYWVTFASAIGDLTDDERDIVLSAIRHWDGTKIDLYAAVVMKEHVHMLFAPKELRGRPGEFYDLSGLLQNIKGFSGREISQRRGGIGQVWVKESFDRWIRNEEDFSEKWRYIAENPVKEGLAPTPQEYRWWYGVDVLGIGIGAAEVAGPANKAELRSTAPAQVPAQSHAREGIEPGSCDSDKAELCPTPVCVFVKHTNSCGAAIAADPIEAYRKAYLGDPNAAMGGILAVNFEVTHDFATAVMESLQRWGKAAGAGAFFVEVWIAPGFADGAVEVIRTAKKWGQAVRLMPERMTEAADPTAMQYRSIAGGMLVQTPDLIGLNEDQWKVVTQRQPTETEMDDLRLAWLICKHTKSNAITVCKDGMLIGNGAGQMSRVMSCRIATWLAKENKHAEALRGAAAASDAFFPFRDGPDILMDAGVTAIIQPGGSKRDEDTIAACNERGVAMIFTGTRHFKH